MTRDAYTARRILGDPRSELIARKFGVCGCGLRDPPASSGIIDFLLNARRAERSLPRMLFVVTDHGHAFPAHIGKRWLLSLARYSADER